MAFQRNATNYPGQTLQVLGVLQGGTLRLWALFARNAGKSSSKNTATMDFSKVSRYG